MDQSSTQMLHLYPRLYVAGALGVGVSVPLSEDQSHYLRHVLRQEEGAFLRVFNAESGEFLAKLGFFGKKHAVAAIDSPISSPVSPKNRLFLLFSPLKKDKMDFLIEKSVELGVTDLQPVLFQRSIVREVKPDRIKAQITEATEQCERLDLPSFHSLQPLERLFRMEEGQNRPVLAAIERGEYPLLGELARTVTGDVAFLVGPEGGLTPDEINFLKRQKFVQPVSLGARILRAETAALLGLGALSLYSVK